MLIPKESQDYRMMEVGRVSSGCHPVQSDYTGPPRDSCPGSCLFSFSKDGDSPAFQVNLLHCLVTLTGKRCSMMFRGKLLVSVCAHCLWSCHWAPPKRAWLYLLFILPSGISIHSWDTSEPSVHHAQESHSLTLYSCVRYSSPLIVLVWCFAGLLHGEAHNCTQHARRDPCWAEDKDHLPWSSRITKDLLGLECVLVHEVIPPQVQHLAFFFFFSELHGIPIWSFLHVFKGYKRLP